MINAKTLSFLSLVIQQTCLVLVIRYSKTRSNNAENGSGTFVPYLASVVVFSSEVYKLILNGILEIIITCQIKSYEADSASGTKNSSKRGVRLLRSRASYVYSRKSDHGNGEAMVSTLKRLFDVCNKESLKLIIPAILYVIQNNLLFYALSNLSVPVYQITNQGKLLTTAIISRIMLQKQITNMQYFSIALLGLGVALVHISEYQANLDRRLNENEQHDKEGNQWLGLLAVFVSCVTSGFAGVYFELILKATRQSVYCRNFHLAVFSLLLASIHILYADYNKIEENGMFQGFDKLVVLIVVMQGMTGFVVSMMFKYADAVLKGFSTSIAVVVATIASFFLFETSLNAMFALGATMVASAVKMYSYYGKKTASLSKAPAKANKKSFGRWNTLVLSLLLLSLVFNAISIPKFYTEYADIISWEASMEKESDLPTASIQQPFCSPEDQYRIRPEDVTKKKYELVRKSEEIAAYIVTELHKVGAPVTLVFGTALHEYRNGTGNCVQPYFKEDDFDIGVFSHHFHYVASLMDTIKQKFGWQGVYREKKGWKDNFMYFKPPGQRWKRNGLLEFQIDVYGFNVDQPREGLIYFPWDHVKIDKHALLPLVKHKPVVSSNETGVVPNDSSVPHFYMPYDIHCYLTNLYGETYMTPQPGFKLKDSGKSRFNKFNNPPCVRELSDRDSDEMQRQMSFSNKTYELQPKADQI